MSIQDQIVAGLAQVAAAIEQQHELQRAVLQATERGSRLRGNRSVPIGTGGRVLAWAGTGRLVGWTLAAGATAATVTFRDSRDTGGQPIAGPITVPANTSVAFALPDGGAGFSDGLFVDGGAGGAFSGVAWIGGDS